MVKGGVEAEVTALLAHVDGAPQASVARIAARGVVAILARGGHSDPAQVLRRCLVGVPCAVVDEVASASAALVTVGVIDADSMIGELLAALAANAATDEVTDRPPSDPSQVSAFSVQTKLNGPTSLDVAAALVRGIGLVVAVSMASQTYSVCSARAGNQYANKDNSKDTRKDVSKDVKNELKKRQEDWAGPAHPLARALRTCPNAAPAPTLETIFTILGAGPDSASVLSRASPQRAFECLRPLLRHLLLSDLHFQNGFRQSLHARLVRVACSESPLAVPSAVLLAKCLPWYRGPAGRGGLQTGNENKRTRDAARDAWIASASADVADAIELAFSFASNGVWGGVDGAGVETDPENETKALVVAAKRAAEGLVSFLSDAHTVDAEPLTKSPYGFCQASTNAHRAALLGSCRRLLAVATRGDSSWSNSKEKAKENKWASNLACDLGCLVPSAFERNATEAAAVLALLARFFSEFETTTGGPGTGGPGTVNGPGTGSRPGNVNGPTSEPSTDSISLVSRHTAAGAVIAARVSSALGLLPARGGRLAAALGTAPSRKPGFSELCFSKTKPPVVKPEESRFEPETCHSRDASLAHALGALWVDGDAAVDKKLIDALRADGVADDCLVAADRSRRRGRLNASVSETETKKSPAPSAEPPFLPLVLLSHPSPIVRQHAAHAFAERVKAVPQRAPAATPPLVSRLRVACGNAFRETVLTADGSENHQNRQFDEAKALLAGIHAITAGACHPLGAPVALRALGGLLDQVCPVSDGTSKLSQFFPTQSPPDPRSHALSLSLLVELWVNHRGAFPRLKAALEAAVNSRSPEVLIGAAAACARAARADPFAAVELAGPLRVCLSENAPAPATALALEAIASLCAHDALDFYQALKVVVNIPHLKNLPKDPLVASRWVSLLGHGTLDALARPTAAAAAVAAAFAATAAGVASGPDEANRWHATRASAYDTLRKYDPSTLLEPVIVGEDETQIDAPAPGADVAAAYLTEPSDFLSKAVDAGQALLVQIVMHERKNMARAMFATATGAGATTRNDSGKADSEKAAAVASLAAADALLHKVLKVVPRKLRSMPRLAGGSGDRNGSETGVTIGPAGPGAHLLLFRPNELDKGEEEVEIVEVETEAEDDAKKFSKTKKNETPKRLHEKNALRRDKADAHRRAFRLVCSSLASPPNTWHWHVSLTHKSWARFGKRWVDAELVSIAGSAGASESNNPEANEQAFSEARASVIAVAVEQLQSASPDVVQNAAALLTSPSLCVPEFAENIVDVLLSRLSPLEKGSGKTDGCERNVCVALGVAAGACHSSDRERREKTVLVLTKFFVNDVGESTESNTAGCTTSTAGTTNTKGTTTTTNTAAHPASAAQGLGMFARTLGKEIAREGPGSGAWRSALLVRTIKALVAGFAGFQTDERNGFSFERNAAAAGGFAVGFVLAAVAADAAERGGVALDIDSFGDEERSDEKTNKGQHTFAVLGVLTRLLERGVASSSDENKNENENDGNKSNSTENAATAAARALPAAAAAALVAGAPADALVLRALRACTNGALFLPKNKKSLRVACLASAGALLDAALAAGVATPRRDVAAAVDAIAAPLVSGSSTDANTDTDDSVTHASAVLGLAAAIGGTWCLAGVGIKEDSQNPGLATGGRRAAPSAETNINATISTPLLWGCEFGAKQARFCLKVLESCASGEGTSGSAGSPPAMSLRARETAAWGLAMVADAAVARAGASVVAGSASQLQKGTGTSKTAVRTPSKAFAIGVLLDAALLDDSQQHGRPFAAARALRVLAHLDRLPAGDWPGAMRRLSRRAAALESGVTNVEGNSAINSASSNSLAVARELRDACAELASRHPGPGVGGAFLELVLGDVTSNNLPPTAVLANFSSCVSALPPAKARETLAVVVAAAAEAQRTATSSVQRNGGGSDLDDRNDARDEDPEALIRKIEALWCGLAKAAGVSQIASRDSTQHSPQTARSPWPVPAIVAAACDLASSLRSADGRFVAAAVQGVQSLKNANPKLFAELPRAAARAVDERAPFWVAESFRTRIVASGALDPSDLTPLVAWDDSTDSPNQETKVDRFRKVVPATRNSPLRVKTRVLIDAIAHDEVKEKGARLSALAATTKTYANALPIDEFEDDSEIDFNSQSKTTGRDDFVVFPVAARCTVFGLMNTNDQQATATAKALCTSIFLAAASKGKEHGKSGGTGEGDESDVRSKISTIAAARLLRHEVSDELWERDGWRLE